MGPNRQSLLPAESALRSERSVARPVPLTANVKNSISSEIEANMADDDDILREFGDDVVARRILRQEFETWPAACSVMTSTQQGSP